jgi:hypothetical protein
MNDTQPTSLKEIAEKYAQSSYYAIRANEGCDVDWQQVRNSATYHLKSASNYHAATWVQQVILAIQIARWVMWIIRQLKQRQRQQRRQAKG